MELPEIYCQWKKGQERKFISYWAAMYRETTGAAEAYDQRISQERFSKTDIRKLFDWKNGMAINGHQQKTTSLQTVLDNVNLVNKLKKTFDPEAFGQHFGKMSAIWQIFLLHLIDPNEYPIFDQHVYRAYVFITDRHIVQSISGTRKQQLTLYEKDYCPFFRTFRPPRVTLRQVDNALWTFGRFLKSPFAERLMGAVCR